LGRVVTDAFHDPTKQLFTYQGQLHNVEFAVATPFMHE